MIDLKAIRTAAEADLECPIEGWETSISEIQSATVIALLDRLEAAEAEVLEQARLLGISGEKELGLMAKLEAAEKDAARLDWLFDNLLIALDMIGCHRVNELHFVRREIDAARKEQK